MDKVIGIYRCYHLLRCGYFSSKNNSGVKDVDYLWRIWP